MFSYIIKRIALIIPTVFGILLINFLIIQTAPGGPVEQFIAKMEGLDNVTNRIGSSGKELNTEKNHYRGAQGLDSETIREIEIMYGFDKPMTERFISMIKSYAQLDFGQSLFRDTSVIDLIIEKLPTSVSIGLWSTLLTYLISIPLGIKKATKDGSNFDIFTSTAITIGYAVPAFLFSILLIVIFSGGSYLDWFPLRGITSEDFDDMSTIDKIIDYLWHMTLPVTALTIGGFATLTFLTKNSFLDEMSKQYAITARSKGITENRILYGHVFRNAMLIIVAGIPSAFIGVFFTGSLLIEVIFSLDGVGLLSFESAIKRDYPVIFGMLFLFTLANLVAKLIGDIIYTIVDPRIDFEKR